MKPEAYQMLQNTHFGGDYALSWEAVDRDWADGKALTHTGSNTMYLALAWVAPIKDFAILLFTNEDLDSFNAADEAVFTDYYDCRATFNENSRAYQIVGVDRLKVVT